MKLKDSVILVTGAARRVGRATALALARGGACLILHYHRSKREVLSLQKEIAAIGGKSHCVSADLSRLAEVEKLVRRAYRFENRIDVLVNNASLFYPTPLGKASSEEWDELFDVNAKAPFFLSQAIGEKMKLRKRGKIIHLGDVAALKPYPGYLPYSASKAALVSLTQGLAKALAPHVTVNAILPGAVMLPESYGVREKKRILRKIPLRKIGSPEDVAQAVRFLIEGGDYITGALLPVDGGYSLL
ncbi:MAG: SDR family oxidoreductase [bacterium]